MRVAISPRAERDLEMIGDYIAEDNPARAVTFITELRDRCAAIAKAPHACRLRPELGEGVRSCAHHNYVIFFTATKARLTIVRVLHGAMDFPPHFSAEQK
jgi:toxin ParE1/3/4